MGVQASARFTPVPGPERGTEEKLGRKISMQSGESSEKMTADISTDARSRSSLSHSGATWHCCCMRTRDADLFIAPAAARGSAERDGRVADWQWSCLRGGQPGRSASRSALAPPPGGKKRQPPVSRQGHRVSSSACQPPRPVMRVRLACAGYVRSYQGTSMARPSVWKKRLKPRNAGVTSRPMPRDATSTAWTTVK